MRVRPTLLAFLACVLPAVLAQDGDAAGAATVVPLSVAAENPQDPDGRIFGVAVGCGAAEGKFALNCLGPTRVSKSFAREAGMTIKSVDGLEQLVDTAGEPVYAGGSDVTIRFGGKDHAVEALVMKDKHCQQAEKQGALGFDVVSAFQWEVNPDPAGPTLTLREPGTKPGRKPLGVVPLKVKDQTYYASVKVRNAPVDMGLMLASSYVQAAPDLQRRWDLNSGNKVDVEFRQVGDVRIYTMKKKDVIELTRELRETNLPVALVGDPDDPEDSVMAESGLGQALLNRFVYCVDGEMNQLIIRSRVKSAGAMKKGVPPKGK